MISSEDEIIIGAIALEMRARAHILGMDVMDLIDLVKRSLIDSPEEEEAHWIETEVRGTTALICSSCGKDTGTIFEYDICPNCGKKMNKAATWRLKGGTDI